MIGTGKILRPRAALLFVLTLMAATPPAAAFECFQWDVPSQLIVRQGNGQHITFELEQEGADFHGRAVYRTTEKQVVGNVNGNITDGAFYARVLWTDSGVSAISRYEGRIRPYREVPFGQPTDGYVHEGSMYDEYKNSGPNRWSADRFLCHVYTPPPPIVESEMNARDASLAEEKKDNAALATIATEQNTVKAQARVRLDPAAAPGPLSKLTICEKARVAKARNSPAAPGLEQQCLANGGSMAEPVAAEKLAELAARGGPIAAADPLSVALRAQQTEAGQLGFDIGMAAAENQTAPGPGKQHIHDSLPSDQQQGYAEAVAFSLERNRNRELAATGAAIALADGDVALARNMNPNAYYQLGFDIATGIFGDPGLGARGNTATGPGSLGIRDTLSTAGQRGFNAAVEYHLARNRLAAEQAGARGSDDHRTLAAEALKAHNKVRTEAIPAPVPVLPPMNWSDAAATVAQGWADNCQFMHNPQRGGLGENLFATIVKSSMSAAVAQWAGEGAAYNYGDNSCSNGGDGNTCTHYTQIVWRSSVGLGCGMKNCETGSPFGGSETWQLWVCNYSPPGNVLGKSPY